MTDYSDVFEEVIVNAFRRMNNALRNNMHSVSDMEEFAQAFMNLSRRSRSLRSIDDLVDFLPDSIILDIYTDLVTIKLTR